MYREFFCCTCSWYPWPPASLRHHWILECISYMTLDKPCFSFFICRLGIMLLEWMEAKITDVCNVCWYSPREGRHNRSANKLLWLFSISVNGKALQSGVQSKYNRVENYMCRAKKDDGKTLRKQFHCSHSSNQWDVYIYLPVWIIILAMSLSRRTISDLGKQGKCFARGLWSLPWLFQVWSP